MMATVTGMGRRMARWMAGLAAAACCVAGVALPAHAADEEPISLPQTAPSQAPSPGFLGVFNCLCIRLLFERIDA